jgi:predicted MPP superfamily phosphohydrolase
VFKILELSDIHFVPDAAIDVNAELSDAALIFATEIRGRYGEVDVIVVCGDIAFAGREDEYKRASTFLRNLEVALGSPRILVVPGNHDIYRPLTKGADQVYLRSSARRQQLSAGERDRCLGDMLADNDKGEQLLAPLQQYLNFAVEYGCTFEARKPFWELDLPLVPGVEVRFRGLTSVLVSDASDEEYKLLLGRLQTASIKHEPGIFNITICHHEFDWLLDGEDQRNIIDNRSCLHISGHDHCQELRETRAGLHLHSGALQPDRREDNWESRINLITIETEVADGMAASTIEVHAALFDPTLDRFVWEEVQAESFTANTEVSDTSLSPAPREEEIIRLHRRLANLTSGDRFQVARVANLDLPHLASLPVSAIVAAMIEDAKQRNTLDRVWDEVERRHGRQASEENPFA